MKKITIIYTLLLLFSANTIAQDSTQFNIPIKNWNLKLVSGDEFYPTYLADPLGIRFGVSAQTMKYSDFDHSDMVNEDGTYLGKLVGNPGVRISLFKFSPKNKPNLGVEVDLGLTIPTFMRAGNHDVIGLDGIYYFAIGGSPTEWLDLRFSKHHICTHIGDEFPDWVKSPTDYDYNRFQLPVRDDFIISAAARPLYFLGNEKFREILQIYGDFGFYMPGKDFMGGRQNKSNNEAYLNLQGGAELVYGIHRYVGEVFTAYNVSAYQLNAYSPNQSFSIGYIFPQDKFDKRLRVGLNWYNGRSWSNQFFNRKEKFVAFFVEADI